MNSQRSIKNVIIGVLLVAVFGLSVAYALNVTQLRIEGTANLASPTRTWAIDVTASSINAVGANATFDVEPTTTTNGETKNIVFTCSIDEVDEKCLVGFAVSNMGNIPAVINYSTLGLSLTRSDNQVFSNATCDNSGSCTISDDYVTLTFLGKESTDAVLDVPGSGNNSRMYTLDLVSNELPESDLTYTINLALDFDEYVEPLATPANGD